MRREDLVELKNAPSQIETSNEQEYLKYVAEISKYPQLTLEQEKDLAKKIEQGDNKARCILIKANLKLVLTIAKKTIHVSNLPYVDLIQEGTIGLMSAIEKYNYRLGYRFSTYATWWIRQAMFKAISEQSHCMKIPVYIQETLSKYSKIKSQLEQNSAENVKLEDIAKEMRIPAKKLELFLSTYTQTISIEGGIEGVDMKIEDVLPDNSTPVSENIEFVSLQKDMKNVISTLKDREKQVVKMHFGLGNTQKYTLEEIGNMYGVTKECIRQTELRALKKMKVSSGALLNQYLY